MPNPWDLIASIFPLVLDSLSITTLPFLAHMLWYCWFMIVCFISDIFLILMVNVFFSIAETMASVCSLMHTPSCCHLTGNWIYSLTLHSRCDTNVKSRVCMYIVSIDQQIYHRSCLQGESRNRNLSSTTSLWVNLMLLVELVFQLLCCALLGYF
jgi:hypothetical protein